MKTQGEIVIKAKAYAESIGNEDGTSAYDYVMGYNQCQEDMTDKKYTEEDMLKCWNTYGYNNGYNQCKKDMADKDKWTFEEILDACYPSLGRGSDWCDIAIRLKEQKLNKQD